MNYNETLQKFNVAAGSEYSASVGFVRFRNTKKGIRVTFSCGKPEEIARLAVDIDRAWVPYYKGWK